MISLPVTHPEYLYIRKHYIKLTRSYQDYYFKKHDYLIQTSDAEFIGGMPVTMDRTNFKPLLRLNKKYELVYNATLKLDGERYLLMNAYGFIYLIDRNLFIYKVMETKETKPYLLDGELYNTSNEFIFYIFDCLYYNGLPQIETNYYNRYRCCIKLSKELPQLPEFRCKVKNWFSLQKLINEEDIYKFIQEETNKIEKTTSKTRLRDDGLIIQPFDTHYVPFESWAKEFNVQYKWKPLHHQTIDFSIKLTENNLNVVSQTAVLLVRSKNVLQPYGVKYPDGTKHNAISKITNYSLITPNSSRIIKGAPELHYGETGEFKYTGNNEFKLVRLRPNKQANSLGSAMSVMQFINDPFTINDIIVPYWGYLTSNGTEPFLRIFNRNQLIMSSLHKIRNKSVMLSANESKVLEVAFEQIQMNPALEFEIRMSKSGGKGMDEESFGLLFDKLSKLFHYNVYIIEDAAEDLQNIEDIKSMKRTEWSYVGNRKVPSKTIIKTPIDIYGNNKRYLSYIIKLYQEYLITPEEYKSFKKQIKSNDLSEKNVGKYNGIKYFFSLASEKVIKSKPVTNNNIRIKKRHSFYVLIHGLQWNVDLTVVNSNSKVNYELEVELVNGVKSSSVEDFKEAVAEILFFLITNSTIY
jgi:hypothetical protein